MSLDLSVPANIDVLIGKDSKNGEYKAVVTTDNPYLKITDMISFKTDIPDEQSRWGLVLWEVWVFLGNRQRYWGRVDFPLRFN